MLLANSTLRAVCSLLSLAHVEACVPRLSASSNGKSDSVLIVALGDLHLAVVCRTMCVAQLVKLLCIYA